jgi:translocation and assembly module TamA
LKQALNHRFVASHRADSRARIQARLLLFALIVFAPLLAYAQPIKGYTVDIDGAGKFKSLLADNLDIVRNADREMRLEELQRLVENTPDKIRSLLATEGYFSPTIESSLEQQNGRWVARFNVALGPPTLVSAVDINFSGEIAKDQAELKRMNRLRQQWMLKRGERFRQEEWNSAKNAILKGLLNTNYPAANIANSEARIDPETRTARLSVEVDSGPAFTFGEVQVQGLQRYSREIIDRLNPIEPGEPFSQERLNELQARLQETGYFRSAFATIEVDPENPKRVPIRVDVTENQINRLALGVGISSDTGPNLQVKWLNRNFLERNWRLESELTLDRFTRRVGADLFFPAIEQGWLSGWLPSTSAQYERTDIAGELLNKVRVSGRVASVVEENEQAWSVAYLADRQEVPGVPPNNRQALIASYAYSLRQLDNPRNPRRGYVASTEISVGPKGLLNEEGLARVVGRATKLTPLGARWDTILRGEFGQVFGAGRETVPAELLFRVGGNQSVRGYDFNELGVPVNGAIVGGTVKAVVSAELVYRITPQWGAAVFVDAGNAADSWSSFDAKVGSGIGARWRSPIGPVSIDLAYGHATGEPQLHFSVGYGF